MTHIHVPADVWLEVIPAADWYDAQSPGLGADLLEEIDATLASIAQNPLQFQFVDRPIRRARVKRFPFGVFYSLESDCIFVLAILDLRRSPDHWRKRIPKR